MNALGRNRNTRCHVVVRSAASRTQHPVTVAIFLAGDVAMTS